MADDLKLTGGQEPEEDEERKPRGQSERSQRRHRSDMRERLFTIFERLADSLEGRGDEELAGMIREDAKAMVGGLVSVTKRAPALAGPILSALAVLEPLIAFGRIFRLLVGRLADRRREALEGYDEPPRFEEPAPEEPPGTVKPEPVLEREGIPLAGDDVARPWDLSGS